VFLTPAGARGASALILRWVVPATAGEPRVAMAVGVPRLSLLPQQTA